MSPSILFMLTLFLLTVTALSFSSPPPLCHDHERLALMQFKQSFVIMDQRACAAVSGGGGYHPKVDNWIEVEGVDCCSWDGVECDHNSGHVIGLDLSQSCLYGSINSSNALFQLHQLQSLNLAFNHFNFSLIPSALGNLSMLTYLNLSYSAFTGQIPWQISKLFRLTSLDLSANIDLQLKQPDNDMNSLVQNLTSLKHLDLSYVDIASPIPTVLTNLSSLTSLHLRSCGLLGEFPTPIFHLPNIETLSLINNFGLSGYIPEFNLSSNSKLKELALFNTSFGGELPASTGYLHSLQLLGIGHCNFTGLVPPTLGNLHKLSLLDLGHNSFTGLLPSTLGNLTNLNCLELQNNHFQGESIN